MAEDQELAIFEKIVEICAKIDPEERVIIENMVEFYPFRDA